MATELSDADVMAPPQRELSDADVSAPPPEMTPADTAVAKPIVEPILNAFGQGFREGWGPDQLGVSTDTAKWLSKHGIFAPEGEGGYQNPFHAANELLINTVVGSVEGAFRGMTALFRGGQAAVAEIGEQAGQPQLGRELAAMPEAFFGSPGTIHGIKSPMEMPRIEVRPGSPPIEISKARPTLVVARQLPDGEVKVGKPGEIHTDLMTKAELATDSDSPAVANSMGYALPDGKFLTRAEALDFAARNEPERAAFSMEAPEFGLDAATYQEATKRASPVVDLPVARDLGVIGPEKPSINEGTPVEAAERATTQAATTQAAARKPDPSIKSEPVGESTVIDKAGNIRLDLIETSEDAKNVIRQAAEERGGPDAFMEARTGEIPLSQAEALSDATGMPVADMDLRGMGRLMRNDNEVRMAIQGMIQSADETAGAMKKAALTDDPADLIEFQRLRMRHAVLQEQVAGLTAEWGRTGNVFQEFAERAKDAKGLGEFLKEKKGETIDDLREMAKAGSVLDRSQTAKFLNDARNQPPGKIYWTWVNGLISGIITHTKYVFANAAYAATERGVVTPLAAVIGKAKELAGADADRVFFGETAAGGWGMIAATPTSLLATAKSMKAGMRAPLESEVKLRQAAIERGERVPATIERAVNPVTQTQRPIEGIWGRIIGSPGDMAMGIHTYFKIIGERAGLEAEGYRAAVKEGLTMASDPEAFTQRWAYHSANPTEAMMTRAVEEAYKGTFMGELGPHGKRWQQFTKQTPGLKWLFPFSHIPVNLMKATYETTPFAFLDAGMRDNLTGKNGGIAQDKAIARMVVGSSVMGYLTNLSMTGQATGDYPQDPKERDSWKLQGKQPNSVLLGGYWVSFDKFGPAGSLANIGANIGAVVQHLKSEDDDAMTKATWHAADAAAHLVVNEVGFMSLQMLFEALHDEKKGAAWAANTAGSFVPFSSALSQTASVMDPSMRVAKTFVDGLKYRIPGMRETLLPKRDWSGAPVPNPQYGNIIRQRQAQTNPVNLEMDTLHIHPAPPIDRIGGVKLPPNVYDQYQTVAGALTRTALEHAVNSPGWHDLPPVVREETFRATIRATRQTGAAMIQAAYPRIIQQGIENKVNHMTGQKPTKLPELAPAP